jgi:hypothetical protein
LVAPMSFRASSRTPLASSGPTFSRWCDSIAAKYASLTEVGRSRRPDRTTPLTESPVPVLHRGRPAPALQAHFDPMTH